MSFRDSFVNVNAEDLDLPAPDVHTEEVNV
jgi:hypothetical protein